MSNERNRINPTAEFDPTLANLKAKLRAAWMDGDYAAFSAYMKPGATKSLWLSRSRRATANARGVGGAFLNA
jgi:hypothetical protein